MQGKKGWVIEYDWCSGSAFLSWAMGYNRTHVLKDAMFFDNKEAADKELERTLKLHPDARLTSVTKTDKSTRRIKE